MPKQQIHFLTGRLAENALLETLSTLSDEAGFSYSVQVMPITVAALMSAQWIEKKIDIPANTDRVVIPGYCQGDLEILSQQFGVSFERGPKDLRRLREFFGQSSQPACLDTYNIQIIGEINHAPRLSIDQVVAMANSLTQDGADFVDVGCIPGETCRNIGDYVKAICDQGIQVSIDSLNVAEIELAVNAGANLVLSVNHTNRNAAPDWGCEVVVIPDDISSIDSLELSIEFLTDKKVPFRIDPILEPIGLGFADSLVRYHAARKRWPEIEMMMGIGNLTELTDVDSAGVNFLLLGICEELGIRSVLTTQVINWAQSSVAECDIARRLVSYACNRQIPPKNLSDQLITLRDARIFDSAESQLEKLASQIKDNNFRIYADRQLLHLLGSKTKISDADPFKIFDQLAELKPKNLDASHSFYLGYELCKAMIAMQLGKNYTQDETLDWGHLTVEETNRHRLSKRYRKSDS